MLQFGASLTYNTSSNNYDCNTFIIQATGFVLLAEVFSRLDLILLGKVWPIDIKSLQNRLLKVCYVPATSALLPRLLFLLQPLTVLMKQTRQAVCAIKQSILLRCLWFDPTARQKGSRKNPTGNTFWRERLCTVNLLVLTSLDPLLFTSPYLLNKLP